MLNWFKKRKKSENTYYTNEQWVELLSGTPESVAVEELRRILVQGLKPALSKYVDRELDQFVEDVVQDGLLKILDNIGSFRGESKFVTWAMKIAVREGLTELRRKRWNDISIEDLKGPNNDREGESREIFSQMFAAADPSPELTVSQKMLLEKIQGIIDNILTEKQRKALTAVLVHGLSPSVVAENMNMNRNSLYKLIYDARIKIRNELEVEGLDPERILNEISEE